MDKPTFLLVGRQGQGKSSVGNTILQTKRFATKTTGAVASVPAASPERADNDRVVVVDTTGIGDSGSDRAGDVQSVIQLANEASVCGFDAMIYVLKYGVRFTKQEKDAVQMVKSIFGENVFRDWGILVFSYGDNFDLDTEDDGMTFEDWCQEQTGDIKTLFEEVDYRCVLFDNRGKNTARQDQERDKLLKLKPPRLQRYSDEDFQAASAGREKLILLENFQSLKKETDDLLRYVDQRRETLRRNDQRLSNDDLTKQLEVVLQQAKQHYDRLLDKDRGTKVLRELLDQVRLRTIGLGSRIDHLRLAIPVRRNDMSLIAVLFWYLIGLILSSCKIPFNYCLKPAIYFIYGIIARCLQYFYNALGRHQRRREKYTA
ncbi:unnamed protein product [Lymnaea stagnalis]|uniref:AIG1-type G domain-containing protein n=1 Tax=Lymnaea stagnalis TaxID=6523 RepID=A0AAV2IKH8_LYMST